MPLATFRLPVMGTGVRGLSAMKRWPVLLGAAVLAACSGVGTGSDPSRDVVSTCQDSVKKQLKDPDSARFDGWTAQRGLKAAPLSMTYDAGAGDAYWTASGEVNAKNSFGGYVGSRTYSCDAIVSKSGNIHARARDGASEK